MCVFYLFSAVVRDLTVRKEGGGERYVKYLCREQLRAESSGEEEKNNRSSMLPPNLSATREAREAAAAYSANLYAMNGQLPASSSSSGGELINELQQMCQITELKCQRVRRHLRRQLKRQKRILRRLIRLCRY